MQRYRALIVIVGVAFVLRVGWMLHASPQPVSDYRVYQLLAENLLDEQRFGLTEPTALQLPGHPWLLAGLMLVSRTVGWLSLWMVVLSTAACAMVYLLGRRLTGREDVSLVAAAICATSPTLIVYAPVLGAEHLFVLLMLGAILAALSPGVGRPLGWALVGALTGLAVLTRGEAVFYVPVLLGVVWIRSPDLRARVRAGGILLAGVAVVISPWMVRNSVVVEPGVYLSTVGGMNFYFGHNPDHYGWTRDTPWPVEDDLAANRLGWELGLEYVRERPLSLLESVRDGTFGLFGSPDYAYIWATQEAGEDPVLEFSPRYVPFENVISRAMQAAAAVHLALAGASFLAWRSWTLRLRVVAGGLLLCNWLGHAVLFFGHPRFRYTIDVVLTVLVALTAVTLWRSRLDGGHADMLAVTAGDAKPSGSEAVSE